MAKGPNQKAKTRTVVFNQDDADRIASAVISIEEGPRYAVGRTADRMPPSNPTVLFKLEGELNPCGWSSGKVARWQKCGEEEGEGEGCGWKIVVVDKESEPVELLDNSQQFHKAKAAYELSGCLLYTSPSPRD